MRISDWSSDMCSSDLIAVVDEAAAGEVGTARETVDQRGEFDVAQFDARQQVVGRLVEQAAVVGRQADRVVALVDGAEQAAQMLPDARGSGAEHVAARSEERRVGKEGGSTCRSRW